MEYLLAITFMMLPAFVFAENSKVKKPDCYCTDKTGARVELGTMVCLQVGGRDFIARCEMSLNNPMWREIRQGCLSSQNQTSDPHNPHINTFSVGA